MRKTVINENGTDLTETITVTVAPSTSRSTSTSRRPSQTSPLPSSALGSLGSRSS